MRSKRENKFGFLLLSMALLMGHNMLGQGIVPVQFVPLLLSPSFTGSDTSARLVLAGQNTSYSHSDNVRAQYDDTENKAFFTSYDKMNFKKTKAFGMYAHYQEMKDAKDFYLGDQTKLTNETEYRLQLELGTKLLELGFMYKPKLQYVLNTKKKHFLIPALFVNYSNVTTHEYHMLKSNYSPDTNTSQPGNYPSQPYVKTEDRHIDTALGHKDIHFHRVAIGGALMFTSPRLFASYQFGLNLDLVAMDYSYYKSSQSYLGTSVTEVLDNRADHYTKLGFQIEQRLAAGLYFPKRTNSFFRFSPVIVISHVFSPINSPSRPLIYNQDYYFLTPKLYDYQDRSGFAVKRLSLNVRVWKMLFGISMGWDWNIEMYQYYIGFNAHNFTFTLGRDPEQNGWNATLKLLLAPNKTL